MIQIPVKIEVGGEIVARFPLFYIKDENAFSAEVHSGIVTKIINTPFGKNVQFAADNGNTYTLPEWRIMRFTFGGILVPNSKYDINKINLVDRIFI